LVKYILLLYLFYSQNWLNLPVDHHDFGYIAKLTKINIGCKAFYSMENPKGTFRVPSIIGKTSLVFSSILSPYASYFASVKAKQCWFLYSKGLSLEPPSYLFIYLFLIIIILAQMDKSIAERKPFKIFIYLLI
jgi:hypothetical protein